MRKGHRCVRALLWLDERGRDYLPLLAEWFGAEWLHRTTGKPIDLTPAISRIAWLRDHEPQIVRAQRHVYRSARVSRAPPNGEIRDELGEQRSDRRL